MTTLSMLSKASYTGVDIHTSLIGLGALVVAPINQKFPDPNHQMPKINDRPLQSIDFSDSQILKMRRVIRLKIAPPLAKKVRNLRDKGVDFRGRRRDLIRIEGVLNSKKFGN